VRLYHLQRFSVKVWRVNQLYRGGREGGQERCPVERQMRPSEGSCKLLCI
jgi:hypothetical protein